MTLEDQRRHWERGGEVLLVVCWEDLCFSIVKWTRENPFSDTVCLHRYFLLGNHWEVSIDVRDATLQECLDELTKQQGEQK